VSPEIWLNIQIPIPDILNTITAQRMQSALNLLPLFPPTTRIFPAY